MISLESPGNQPNNYDVRCNNGAACLVEPGRKPYCETKAEYETYLENMEAANTQWCADRAPSTGTFISAGATMIIAVGA